MPLIQFTPAFKGDEYHAPGLHIESEGVFEVTGAQLSYLTKTFSKRFTRAEELQSDQPTNQPAVVVPEVTEPTNPNQEPVSETSATVPAVEAVQSEPSPKTVLESVKSAVSGKKGKK